MIMMMIIPIITIISLYHYIIISLCHSIDNDDDNYYLL